MKLSYFLLAVIFFGSMGVWVPLLYDLEAKSGNAWHSFPLNLGTYYVAILFGGSIEYFLSKYKRIHNGKVGSLFLNIVWIIVLAVISFLYLNRCYNKGDNELALIISVAGTLGAWVMWWLANEHNENLTVPPINPKNASPAAPDLLSGDAGNFKL